METIRGKSSHELDFNSLAERLADYNHILSSSRKGLNMVYLALTKETKEPCPSLPLKITESCDLNKS